MKKTLLNILTLLCALAANVAAAADETDSRIKLVVYPADTVDGRVPKMITKVNVPQYTPPHSDGYLSSLNGPALAQALNENARAKAQHADNVYRATWQEYIDAKRRQEERLLKILNTPFGRLIVNATDWLAAALGKHDEIFSGIIRTDMSAADVEENLKNGGGDARLPVGDYLVQPSFSDLKGLKETLQFPGGTRFRVTRSTTMSLHIIGLGRENSQVHTFPIKSVSEFSGAILRDGDDARLEEDIQKAFVDIATEIANKFSSLLTVKVRGPQTDFEADDVRVTLDGRDIQRDAPTRVLKGKYLPQKTHTLKAEMDGFAPVTIQLPCDNDTTTRTITMRKATDEKQTQQTE